MPVSSDPATPDIASTLLPGLFQLSIQKSSLFVSGQRGPGVLVDHLPFSELLCRNLHMQDGALSVPRRLWPAARGFGSWCSVWSASRAVDGRSRLYPRSRKFGFRLRLRAIRCTVRVPMPSSFAAGSTCRDPPGSSCLKTGPHEVPGPNSSVTAGESKWVARRSGGGQGLPDAGHPSTCDLGQLKRGRCCSLLALMHCVLPAARNVNPTHQ